MDEKSLDVMAATKTETDQAAKVLAECFKSVFMLENADPRCFLTLFTDLRKAMTKKHNDFPHTVVETFDMWNRWRPEGSGCNTGSNNQQRRRRIGHTHTQTMGPPPDMELIPGRDGTTANLLCYGCQNWEHIRPNCPNGRGCNRHSLMQYRICIIQCLDESSIASDGAINKAWILLDLCSTLSCICNPSLMTNIRPCTDSELMAVYTNGGQVKYDQVGTFS